jgi:hypothetical protein
MYVPNDGNRLDIYILSLDFRLKFPVHRSSVPLEE